MAEWFKVLYLKYNLFFNNVGSNPTSSCDMVELVDTLDLGSWSPGSASSSLAITKIIFIYFFEKMLI